MGLTIRAKTTEESISYSYSKLHHNLRWLILIYCGMPEKIDSSFITAYSYSTKNDKEIDPLLLFLTHHEDFGSFLFSLQMAGHLFPNCMLHSDCDGVYTRRGKILSGKNLLVGNSIDLLKELSILINDQDLKQKSENNERIKNAMDYVNKLYSLVKNEIENGIGAIIFS